MATDSVLLVGCPMAASHLNWVVAEHERPREKFVAGMSQCHQHEQGLIGFGSCWYRPEAESAGCKRDIGATVWRRQHNNAIPNTSCLDSNRRHACCAVQWESVLPVRSSRRKYPSGITSPNELNQLGDWFPRPKQSATGESLPLTTANGRWLS